MTVFDSGVFDAVVFDAETSWGLISSPATVFTPTQILRAQFAPVPLIDQTSTILAPVGIRQSLSLGRIDALTAIFTYGEAGPYPFIDASAVVFSPVGIRQQAVLPAIAAETTIYPFSTASAVYADLPIQWQDGATRGQTLTLGWADRNAVGQTLAIDAPIYASAGKDLTLDWTSDGTTQPGATLTTSYRIDGVSPVNILYDGQDITPIVHPNGCTFTTRAGGIAGTATLYLKVAANHAVDYTPGVSLDLRIGGDWVWRGFVTKITHEYPFAYDDTDGLTPKERWVRLEGTDINVLFSKRVVYRSGNPNQPGPIYTAAYTPDTTAIRELLDHWVDLGSDGLIINYVTSEGEVGIHHVDAINVDQDAHPINPAGTFGQSMGVIASMPGAIFYIDPDKRLVYCDVDTPTAYHALSDTPAAEDPGLLALGYREMTFIDDGTQLANDYLAWGITRAGNVFTRVQDADSIALHGRWQDATVRNDVYKQATIDKIANTAVYGSPFNHRGHRDNKPRVMVRTPSTDFRVAQKVRFISHTHGIDEVIPIRELTVMFPDGFRTPMTMLTLSHEIDSLSFADFIPFPKLNVLPPITGDHDGGGGGGGGGIDPGYACTLLDGFQRNIPRVMAPDYSTCTGGGWGDSENGLLHWSTSSPLCNVNYRGQIECHPNDWAGLQVIGDGGWGLSAGTTLPGNVHNLLIEFSVGMPEMLITGTATGECDGIQWNGAPIEWVNLEGASNWDPVTGSYGSVAYVPASVNGSSVAPTAHLHVTPLGSALRTIYAGTGDPGPGWYPGIGAGIIHNADVYLGGWFNPGVVNDFTWVMGSPGLAYYGGTTVSSVLYAASGFREDIRMKVSISTGLYTITMTRSADGQTTTSISGGLGQEEVGSLPLYLYPGSRYMLRIFRPNDGNTHVKVWSAPSSEPLDWTVSKSDGTQGIGSVGTGLSISGVAYNQQSYEVDVHRIWTCDTWDGVPYDTIWGLGEPLPTYGWPAPGTVVTDDAGAIVRDPNSPCKTRMPYVPGSLFVWCNGTIQRRDVDFTETDPAAGIFTLLFTRDVTDQIYVTYIAA